MTSRGRSRNALAAAAALVTLNGGCSAADHSAAERSSGEDVAQTSEALVCGANRHVVCPDPDLPALPRPPKCHCEFNTSASIGAPSVFGVQPGWVRATFDYSLFGDTSSGSWNVNLTCADGTPRASVTTEFHYLSSSKAAVDVRADLDWLAKNGLPKVCQVTSLALEYDANGLALATSTFATPFQMDLPLSHLLASQFPTVVGTEVNLRPTARRHVAYPPLIIAVRTSLGLVGFIEVEELRTRNSVGLRALNMQPDFAFAQRELGGGAEIFPDFGLDIDKEGITKNVTPVEESHPGFNEYAYSGSIFPPIASGDKSLFVYPAPPTFSDATYLSNVLDNRGVPRCTGGSCLDVQFDAATHTLRAVNGAAIQWLDDGPIQPGAPSASSVVSLALLNRPVALPGVLGQLPFPLLTSALEAFVFGRLANTSTFGGAGVLKTSAVSQFQQQNSPPVHPQSPEEQIITARRVPPPDLVPPGAGPVCGLDAARDGAATPLTHCGGISTPSHCSTRGNPAPIFSMPAAPGTDAELSLTSLMPYYAGRANRNGTCGSHTLVQQYEALVNKLADDVNPKRTYYVNGEPVVVPEPRIAYSVTGNLQGLYTWGGVKAGDPDLEPTAWPTAADHVRAQPQFLEAYWPAREPDFDHWQYASVADPRGAAALARCREKGFWFSAFCVGQGSPPPGAYRNYSQQVAMSGGYPFLDGIWSLANSYFDLYEQDLSLANRDQAITDVVAQLRSGFPVTLAFLAYSQDIPDGAGGRFNLLDNMGWYLPPELGACTSADLNAALQPDPHSSHAVNLIGYSIVGSMSAPDPYKSFFIVENNWGKDYGYNGYFTMNFAAFKYLAGGLQTYRLVCNLPSSVCHAGAP